MDSTRKKIYDAGYAPNWTEADVVKTGDFYRFGPQKVHWMVRNEDGSLVIGDWTGRLPPLCFGETGKGKGRGGEWAKTGRRTYCWFDPNDYKKEPNKSTYLISKKLVDPPGIWYGEDHIAIPVQNISGYQQTVQKIWENGQKQFLGGHPVKGGFFHFGFDPETEIIIFCEGFATGASIYQSIQRPTIVTFGSSNINEVIGDFRKKYPSKNFMIAADDDIFTSNKNAGREAATKAARMFGCKLIFPKFKNLESKPTDFNDLHVLEGIDVLKEQLMEGLLSQPMKQSEVLRSIEDYITESGKHYRKFIGLSIGNQECEIIIKGETLTDTKAVRAILGNKGMHFDDNEMKAIMIRARQPSNVMTKLMDYRCGWRMTDPYFYLPPLDYPTLPERSNHQDFKRYGTLQLFKDTIYPIARNNPLVTFVLAYSFLAPFLKRENIQNFGIHLKGSSSTGKTTLLQLAASIWGAPLGSWLSTDNAMETLASYHNDTLLCLDEISQVKPSFIASIIYMLGNGIGKGRLRKTGEAVEKSPFKLNFLSSGEAGIGDIAETTETGGQTVRIIDIDCDRNHGIFDVSENPVRDIERIAELTRNCQNIPIDCFLKQIIENKPKLNISTTNEKGQYNRIRYIFDAIISAGELAKEYGCLPDLPIEEHVNIIFEHWKPNDKSSYEMRTAKERLCFLVENDLSCFYHDGMDRKPTKIKGYLYLSEDPPGIYLNTPSLKIEVCKGLNYTYIRQQLIKEGIIENPLVKRFGSVTAQVFKVNRKFLEKIR